MLVNVFELVLQVWEVGEILFLLLVWDDLWIDGYVGDVVVVVGDEGVVCQVLVENVVQVCGFFDVLVDGVGNFFWGEVVEMVVLFGYWFQFVYLLEQLLQGFLVCVQVFGEEVFGFFCEIEQDGVGFEQ